MRDCDVVQFQAVTQEGTWTAEWAIEQQRMLREKRTRFQETVLTLMADGVKPWEAEIDLG